MVSSQKPGLALFSRWRLHDHLPDDNRMEEVLTSVPTRHLVSPELFYVECLS
jgi:hypothetical protein